MIKELNGIRSLRDLHFVIFNMLFEISHLKPPIALFGNGEMPTHEIPLQIVKNAGTIICSDGGANKLKQIGFEPDLILGDMDSVSENSFQCPFIQLKDQSKTDLQKSLDWCVENKLIEISLVGFSGEEDDHWMAALWTLITYYEELDLVFYSNHSKIICIEGEKEISTFKGQTVSIIPSKDDIKITTSSLKYSIENHVLKPPSFGTRNEALGESIYIKASGPIWIFLNYKN